MRFLLFLKTATLILLLYGVFYVMYNLSSSSVEKFFHAMGIEPGVKSSPGFQPANRKLQAGEKRHNICPTRIGAIVLNDGRKVEETKNGLKLKWMAHTDETREISYLEIEKWLSQHCQIAIQPVELSSDQAKAPFSRFVTLKFIDGTEIEFQRGPGNLLKLENQAFRSIDFLDALNELGEIAGWGQEFGK